MFDRFYFTSSATFEEKEVKLNVVDRNRERDLEMRYIYP